MIENVVVSEFTYYKVVFNGNMYEIVNKVFGNTEAFMENIPQAVGQANAFNGVVERYVEEGVITFSGFNRE